MTDADIVPSMTRGEKVLETISTLTSVVPIVGGVASNILTGLSGDHRFERVRTFLLELADRVRDDEAEHETFIRSEDFEDLLVETSQRVWAERSEEKRRLYRDFLVDVVNHPEAEPYDERLRFLRVLERVQEAHVEVLRAVLQEPDPSPSFSMGSMSHVLLNRLGWGEDEAAKSRLADLTQQMGDLRIISGPPGGMMTAAGAENTRAIVTPFGQRLTRFIEEANE